MIFIFGWGRKTSKDFGPTLPMKCGNCNNSTYARLYHIKEWFTLFFIPVIPYKSQYLLICDVCNRGVEINGEDIESAKQLNGMTIQYLNKEISDEQYKSYIKKSNLLSDSTNQSGNWECPNCNKDNDNDKYTCQQCGYKIL
jgi:DNA-directed RNA polymerase subunit RPC12/RpoP